MVGGQFLMDREFAALNRSLIAAESEILNGSLGDREKTEALKSLREKYDRKHKGIARKYGLLA